MSFGTPCCVYCAIPGKKDCCQTCTSMILELVEGSCHDVNNKDIIFKLIKSLKRISPDIPEYWYIQSRIIMRKRSREIKRVILLVESISVPPYGYTKKYNRIARMKIEY